MSNKNVVASKESGAHSFKDKGHLKAEKQSGPHHTKKHELAAKSEGLHLTGKPVVHLEDVNHHSGRQHPPATKLADSKILGGRLRKADQ